MSTTIEELTKDIAGLRADVKSLAKICRKIKSHIEDPTGEIRRARAANNGFNRQQEISPELRAFMKAPEGATASRSEVTKFVNEYIKANGLKDESNGRKINMDDTLRNLLKPDEGIEVTFLNLQKYLSRHYPSKK